MKKIIFAFFALINFSFVFAAWWPEPHQENTTFYQNCKNIDQNTYSIIYGSYGKDKSWVYYWCDKMGIKYPNNFKVLNFWKYKSKLEWDVSSYFASDDYYI